MEPTMSNGVDQSENLFPFVLELPEDHEYHEILKSSQSVTMQSGLVTLQPGKDVGTHNTGSYEELLVILEGTGEVESEGSARQHIKKGCVAYIPPATQHNVFNAGTSPLRYLYIVSRVK